jgi:NMD protein affecting ribosome stability and mRNA decay
VQASIHALNAQAKGLCAICFIRPRSTKLNPHGKRYHVCDDCLAQRTWKKGKRNP